MDEHPRRCLAGRVGEASQRADQLQSNECSRQSALPAPNQGPEQSTTTRLHLPTLCPVTPDFEWPLRTPSRIAACRQHPDTQCPLLTYFHRHGPSSLTFPPLLTSRRPFRKPWFTPSRGSKPMLRKAERDPTPLVGSLSSLVLLLLKGARNWESESILIMEEC
jgi:hypothetical protein